MSNNNTNINTKKELLNIEAATPLTKDHNNA